MWKNNNYITVSFIFYSVKSITKRMWEDTLLWDQGENELGEAHMTLMVENLFVITYEHLYLYWSINLKQKHVTYVRRTPNGEYRLN